ncbi:MAG: hypothetical protein UT61_C0025G0007 [Candidatus Woesebacteria bacterium GW2011_GWA1_39_8]|uniref:Uncharacterized protein n=1 Tax=Candidatus Woesebacteria bacterium GW2011_GWA1_39_8 TaxID=1618552 RepID=A0A0G0S4Q2_9BACT|nr:MAG: hypothetical protein UT61_C0025G0007 [Candidatus Woesebacteria bacterium GW2011_GWA1_39_8]
MKNLNTWLYLGGGLLLAAVLYFTRDKWMPLLGLEMTREKADKILGGTPKTYDDGYVIAWAKAKKSGKESFEVQEKKYSTATGKAI